MFDYGGRDGGQPSGDVRVAAERVFAGPKLSNCIESQDIADVDVLESWDGDQVAGSENELPAGYGGADVMRRLRPNEFESLCYGIYGGGCCSRCARMQPSKRGESATERERDSCC